MVNTRPGNVCKVLESYVNCKYKMKKRYISAEHPLLLMASQCYVEHRVDALDFSVLIFEIRAVWCPESQCDILSCSWLETVFSETPLSFLTIDFTACLSFDRLKKYNQYLKNISSD